MGEIVFILLQFILELLVEILIQFSVQVPLEWLSKRFVDLINGIKARIGVSRLGFGFCSGSLLGLLIGWISAWVYPSLALPYLPLRLLNLVLAPWCASGLARLVARLQGDGERERARGRFAFGFVFFLCLVRFAYL